MSYLPPDQTNNQAPSGTTTNAPGQLPPQGAGGSVGAGTTGGAPKAGAAPNTGTANQFGSSASKLGDYLSANAPQIQQQAGNVASGLNNQYGQVSADVTNGANQFQQSVNNGYTAQNTGLVDQAFQNPTGFVTDPNNVSGFQSQYNDTYSGPQNYESTTPYSQIQNEVSQAVSNAGTLGTQGGLANYFQGLEKNPTQAQASLDSLLVSGDPNAQSQVSQAANQFQNLTPAFQNSTTASDALVPQAQQNAAAANQYAHDQFGNAVTGFNNTVNGEATNANNQFNQYNTQATTEQQQAQNAQAEINAYLSAYSPIGNVDTSSLNPYAALQPLQGTAPTAASAATTQDYQTQAALQQLIGAGVPIDTAIQQVTAGQAGTALPQNFSSLEQALGGYGQAQDTALSNLGTGLNTASQPAIQAAQQIQNFKDYENAEKGPTSVASPAHPVASTTPKTAADATKAISTDQANVNRLSQLVKTQPWNSNQLAAAQKQLTADQGSLTKFNQIAAMPGAQNDNLGQKQTDASTIGQGQWINPADTGYNSLLSYLGSGLAPTAVNTLPTQAQVQPNTQAAGGLFDSLENASILINPATQGSNIARYATGQSFNPADVSLPYAKQVAPIIGGAVGAYYGGPSGAYAGYEAGKGAGGPLQNIGGQGMQYAHGGVVNLEDYLKEGK